MNNASNTYEKTKVGMTGSMHTSSGIDAELEAFQTIVDDFNRLESEGLIEITTRHTESQSGRHYVDLVKFKRIV